MDSILYIKNMLRDKQVASFAPTSHFGVKQLCSKIDFSKRNVIVEFGPGTGVFTRYLLKHLSSDSVLILIERNPDFSHILQNTLHDRRLRIFHDSAENIGRRLTDCQQLTADYIISGIPFSFLPPAQREIIVRASHQYLSSGGAFLAYQTFFQVNHFLKNHLNNYFKQVNTEFCLLNAPPLRIFEAIK